MTKQLFSVLEHPKRLNFGLHKRTFLASVGHIVFHSYKFIEATDRIKCYSFWLRVDNDRDSMFHFVEFWADRVLQICGHELTTSDYPFDKLLVRFYFDLLVCLLDNLGNN